MTVPVLSTLFPVLHLVAYLLLDAPNGVVTGSGIEQWVSQFSVETQQLLVAVNTAFTQIFRITWITLLSAGALLYLTHLHKRLGKQLVGSGIFMLILVQFVLPFLGTL